MVLRLDRRLGGCTESHADVKFGDGMLRLVSPLLLKREGSGIGAMSTGKGNMKSYSSSTVDVLREVNLRMKCNLE